MPFQLVHMPKHMHVLDCQHWQHSSPGIDGIMTVITALRHVFFHENTVKLDKPGSAHGLCDFVHMYMQAGRAINAVLPQQISAGACSLC